jgi:hypothetical protein
MFAPLFVPSTAVKAVVVVGQRRPGEQRASHRDSQQQGCELLFHIPTSLPSERRANPSGFSESPRFRPFLFRSSSGGPFSRLFAFCC